MKLGSMLARRLRRTGRRAAAGPMPGFSTQTPLLSVVTGSYNRRGLLAQAIESIHSNGLEKPYEIIVVDGGSDDGTLPWLIEQRDIITIVQHNRGTFRGKPIERRSWGYFMNLGFKAASGRYIAMISDDCVVLPGALSRALDQAESAEAAGRRVGGVAFYFRNWPAETDYYVQKTLGGMLMVNHGLFLRRALEDVGWADETSYYFYKADGDLCLRLWQAGYEIIDCAQAIVEHYVDENEPVRQSNNAVLDHDRQVYLDRWGATFSPKKIDRITLRYDDPQRTAEKVFGAIKGHSAARSSMISTPGP